MKTMLVSAIVVVALVLTASGQTTTPASSSENPQLQSVAVGLNVLPNNSGGGNTGTGENALGNNTAGFRNTGIGASALGQNTDGSMNTACGTLALNNNIDGSHNTAVGHVAGYSNQHGSNNIFVGDSAGVNIGDGSGNIDIGNPGSGNESHVMRLGLDQTATFIAGVNNTPVGPGSHFMVIDSANQVGTVDSLPASVSSLNGLTGSMLLQAGPGVSITPSGNTFTISATSVNHFATCVSNAPSPPSCASQCSATPASGGASCNTGGITPSCSGNSTAGSAFGTPPTYGVCCVCQ